MSKGSYYYGGKDDPAPDLRPDYFTPEKRRSKAKNTRVWCKGRQGREHAPAITIPPSATSSRPCGWSTRFWWGGQREPYYHCRHAEVCTVCGKILRSYFSWRGKPDPKSLTATDCPQYQPQPE